MVGGLAFVLLSACGDAQSDDSAPSGGTSGQAGATTSGGQANPGGGAPSGGNGGKNSAGESTTPGGNSTEGGAGGKPSAGGGGGGTSAGTNSGGGGTGGGSGGAPSKCAATVTTESRTLAGTALDALFIQKKPADIDKYWADPYLQHNPIAQSGVAAFKSIMTSLVTSQSFSYQRLRTFADCDLVVVQGKYSGTGVIFDMFRVKDGHLMEHWDSDSNQASDSAGTMTHDTGAPTAQNREQVLSFIQQALVEGKPSAALLGSSYVEHRSTDATGPAAFAEYVSEGAISYSKVHHVIADGNFVFTISEGKLSGSAYAFYDLFRVDGGAIVEHWDSRRKVPSSTASGLGIF